MENSGGGATFTDKDIQHAKGITGLLTKGKFSDILAQEMINFAGDMAWYVNELLPTMEANVLELRNVTDINKAPE